MVNMIFQIGETVICSITVKDADGTLQDAATTMNIVIEQITPQFRSLVASTAMTNDSTGTYHYDAATSSAARGGYLITYTATDGARVTIEPDTFTLE